mmetsp:Transcript_37337/g.79240  ORF Transcript_37337/g.79240 Transcript_37337/m.79240 type:complete len:446 (+) Transcript_37337:56-1393(+)|eukprot:CAMPEP_0206564824 /NCGR_PEP_ID=MMETSP0325_2-20121206/23690_1 /ASSEMBLY_ACC=CAM_ASM_000347 /TAXON_ID=2866 /ORGANISM="Crypthecodinium cohnii, Strain Seligo" /LENGTH=445 /DNA_ID=CAMNT_0054067531 /DNA_START=26 /DNA_END=1363 /DNA_ORIENTATION=-
MANVVGAAAAAGSQELAKAGLESCHSEDILWARGVLRYLQGLTQGLPAAGLALFEASLAATRSMSSTSRPTSDESANTDAEVACRHCFVGTLRMHHGRFQEAEESFREAIAAYPQDRLPHLELCLLLEGQRRFEEARLVARKAIEAGAMWQHPYQRPPVFAQKLRSKAFWEKADFPWMKTLEDAFPQIKAELEAVLPESNSDIMKVFRKVGEGGRAEQDAQIIALGGVWRECVLFGCGGAGECTQVFPQTRALLEKLVPSAVEMARIGAGEIIVSALHPGTRLLPHCASSNTRLTCHLGLVCPEGPKIRVGEEWATWQEGQCMVFDDSFEHEVLYETPHVAGSTLRVVLLIRFWHPDLPEQRRIPTLEEGMVDFESVQGRRGAPPLSSAVSKCLEQHQRGLWNGLEEISVAGSAKIGGIAAESDSQRKSEHVDLERAIDEDNDLA